MNAEARRLMMASAFFLSVACAQEATAPAPPVSSQSIDTNALRPGVWRYQTVRREDRREDGILSRVLSVHSLVLERADAGGRARWRSIGETRFPRRSGLDARDTLWLDHSLRPVRQVWHYPGDSARTTVLDLSYSADSAVGTFQDAKASPELRRDIRVALPGEALVLPAYNRSALVYVFKSLPLSEEWTGAFQTVMNGRPPVVSMVSLAVIGEAQVTVPAGTFDCWHLRVIGSPDSQLWVSKDQQILVMTSDGQKGFEHQTVLLSYQRASER
jgi:hypothetical protein